MRKGSAARRLGLLLSAFCLLAAPAQAEVVRVEVTERAPFAGGRSFGAVGAYERIRGRLHYAVDPDDPANARIVDLRLAPRGGPRPRTKSGGEPEDGRVGFAGDFLLLRPLDLARGNHRLLYDVNNRGDLIALNIFNFAPWNNDPTGAADAGDGFLMEQGYSLLWSAWNWDVLPGNGRLQIELPVARDGGQPIAGPLAAEIVTDAAVRALPVVWGHSRGYPPADPNEPGARLTVRPSPQAPRRELPRADWRFLPPKDGAPARIELDQGFQPGLLYELVYTAAEPRVVGLGLAAIRDALSFFRYEAADAAGTANPLGADPAAVIAFGVSQSGRVIQHMLLEALHLDERGRPAFDAAFIHVAGGGKGSFNHRFAQTTRHPSQHEDQLYPADFFPFATVAERDPVTGETAGVLDRARSAGAVPYLFYTSTSTEYWTRSASLLHVDAAGTRDLALDPRARLYVIAGAQHNNGARPERGIFENCGNPLDHRPVLRALLPALERWATAGVAPPASVHPRLANGTLGGVADYRRLFPAVSGLRLPTGNLQPPRLDHGPRFAAEGIADLQPPRRGPPFVTTVPLPDSDGNDRGGLRLPAVAVPLGSHLGWNLRRPEAGAPDALGRWAGSFLPFAATARNRRGDPRPSLAERYPDRATFRARTRVAADALFDQGFLLARDLPAIVATAGRGYDAIMARGEDRSCGYLADW
ncbi:MAG TPA: alpha/beta hydrolase domain-containing protein [Dongiaceae bacterium]|nr:alpha/beta hydrolase domain-containing protein [Dongiaceae bacterium]